MLKPVRILVLDPDQTAGDHKLMLAEPGWVVDRARTFLEALRLAEESSYDVAMVELNLPDLRGVDAWKFLKTLHPALVGILTASLPSLPISINAFEQDPVAYLPKPLKEDAISKLLVQAARKGKAGNGSECKTHQR